MVVVIVVGLFYMSRLDVLECCVCGCVCLWLSLYLCVFVSLRVKEVVQ